LRWAPPTLTDPISIDVTESNAILQLDPSNDYLLRLPTDRALTAKGGLSVTGGHNVVLQGGTISIPWQGEGAPPMSRRGLVLKGQTGTVHVEGVRITGPDLAEGVNLDERLGATVQFQNVRIENPHTRSAQELATHHPDVIQTWAGPEILRIDNLTATTSYQGLFLTPNQYASMPTHQWDLSNVNLTGLSGSAYLLWKSAALNVRSSNVFVTPRAGRALSQSVWTTFASWPGLIAGDATQPEFVSEDAVGVGYTSPAPA
jgi:hypothetical protein